VCDDHDVMVSWCHTMRALRTPDTACDGALVLAGRELYKYLLQ
jgi:hypothetical protein